MSDRLLRKGIASKRCQGPELKKKKKKNRFVVVVVVIVLFCVERGVANLKVLAFIVKRRRSKQAVKTLWPSGLRRLIRNQFSSGATVRIRLVSTFAFLPCGIQFGKFFFLDIFNSYHTFNNYSCIIEYIKCDLRYTF